MRIVHEIDTLLDRLTRPLHVRGLRYARVLLGAIMLYIYGINFAQRHTLFGPQGILTDTDTFSLFHVANPLTFDLLYLLAMAMALCFMLGIGGRLITLGNLLFFWSWTNSALLIGDGGDNILRIMLVYFVLLEVSGPPPDRERTLWQKISAIAHNAGLLAIAIQISTVYFTAGLMKVQGEMWQDGTALYYILQVDEFRNPAVVKWLLPHTTLLVIASYATVFFQLAFPWMLLHPRAKWIAVAVSITFHLGIWITMNLPSFSLIMIALELPLLSDRDYEQLDSLCGVVRNFIERVQAPLIARLRQGREGAA